MILLQARSIATCILVGAVTTFLAGGRGLGEDRPSARTGAATPTGQQDPVAAPRADLSAILIVGGHDHDASFYSLFQGCPGLNALPVASSQIFHGKMAGRYDVVILYDFTRELDEPGRKNLREFVEQGGGVVVLHHALLDYQDWTWWYQDAVGGSYRLKSEGAVPSSTVKDRTTFTVTPDRDHPITAKLEPFELVDEAYKRMWFSENVHPLLTTDNPDSDRVVGWVGPTKGLKVVAIQLGHGPTAFANPSYRALVHNAILWAAGRLK